MQNVAIQLNKDLQANAETLQYQNLSSNEQNIISLFDSCRFDITVKHPASECLLSCEDAPILQKNCLSLCSGKPKCGKGMTISYMIAGVLGAKDLHFVNKKLFAGKILVFDTEQEGEDIEYFNMRINALLNRDIRTNDNRFSLFPLRDLSAKYPNQKFFSLEFIETVIKVKRPDLVIIDNIGDFVTDINNNTEGKDKAQNLLDIAKRYNCHIATVLHCNIGAKPDSEVDVKARGSIGTYLTQKCSTHMTCDRAKGLDGVIEVSFPHTRRKAPKKFRLQIVDTVVKGADGEIHTIAIPTYKPDPAILPKTATDKKEDAIRVFLCQYLKGGKKESQTNLHEVVKERFADMASLNTFKNYVEEKCSDIMQVEQISHKKKLYSLKEEKDLFENDVNCQ